MTNPVRLSAAAAAAALTLTAALADQKPLDLVWFAGGGGSSEGLREAGYPPDYALNHNATALWMHQVNHPECTHLVDDAAAILPASLEPGRRVRSFWASPDCTHFSVARGGAPKSPRIRGLAWVVVDWAEQRQPDVIFVENVKEFTTWGPLHPEGHPRAGHPIKDRVGETFQEWLDRLDAAGYAVEYRVLNCADYGAPTTRKRLFVLARCDGQPIVWPERTHAPRREAKRLGLLPYVSAASCIDWNERCPSIFLTQAEAKAEGLNVKRPLVDATQLRIAKGIERYIVGSPEPFIFGCGGRRGQSPAIPVGEAYPTTTGKADAWVCAPTIVPILNAGWAPERVDDAGEPIRTITAAKGGEFAAAAAYVTKFQENSIGTDPRDAMDTVMAGATRFGVVAGFLGRQFGRSVGSDAGDPVGAITAAVGGKTQLIAANLTAYYATGVGSDVGEPVRTVTGEDRHGLTAAFLEQANTGMVGHDLRDGVSTITGRATQQRLIEVRLSAIGALPGSRRRAVLDFLWRHFGEPTEDQWADPTGTLNARLRFGLVLLDGEVWEIADIGMRMLKPRELFNAQGFRPDYIIDRDPWDRPITTTAATLMVGNSVPPPIARALAAANLPSTEPERLAA